MLSNRSNWSSRLALVQPGPGQCKIILIALPFKQQPIKTFDFGKAAGEEIAKNARQEALKAVEWGV